MDQDQKLPKQQGQKLRVVGLASLQFPDHLFKNPRIFKRSAGGDHAHTVGDAVAPEDIFDIISCKMNPVHLGLFISVIDISLWFLWTVDHHMSGGYYCIFLLIIKIEMGLSRYNVQELEIHPSSGAAGRQPGAGVQMVGAAAPDGERTALSLKSILERFK